MTSTRISTEGLAFLSRFAAELAGLASDLERFQDSLADILAQGEGRPIPVQSQAVDELSQRAHALAAIAARVAVDGALEESSIDGLIAGVTLSALAQRLSSAGHEGGRDEGGELLLFAS